MKNGTAATQISVKYLSATAHRYVTHHIQPITASVDLWAEVQALGCQQWQINLLKCVSLVLAW